MASTLQSACEASQGLLNVGRTINASGVQLHYFIASIASLGYRYDGLLAFR